MPHKVKVSGSRSLKKGSKKNSKSRSNKTKRSSKHTGMDFTAILDDMSGHKSAMANMMGPNQQGAQEMPLGAMDPMQMDQSGMMMQQQAMQGQMMDQAGMQNMMMGKNAQSNDNEVDPLHIQYIVPQNKNLNINNYGISYEQLLRGSQHNGLSDTFNSPNAAPSAASNAAPQNNINTVQQQMNNMNIQ
jgi:hypothetical protein